MEYSPKHCHFNFITKRLTKKNAFLAFKKMSTKCEIDTWMIFFFLANIIFFYYKKRCYSVGIGIDNINIIPSSSSTGSIFQVLNNFMSLLYCFLD